MFTNESLTSHLIILSFFQCTHLRLYSFLLKFYILFKGQFEQPVNLKKKKKEFVQDLNADKGIASVCLNLLIIISL